jgi:hypothetical protein
MSMSRMLGLLQLGVIGMCMMWLGSDLLLG